MLFNEEFISSLREDPVNGAVKICQEIFDALDLENHQGWYEKDFETLIEGYSLLAALIESKSLPITIEHPIIGANTSEDCSNIYQFVTDVKSTLRAEASRLKIESLKHKFQTSLDGEFVYEFSQGDLDRVQVLLNQLRDLIRASKDLEAEHQQRLLRRLEKLQSEIHKKVSDVDRFWGLIGDAGVVIGKLGNDAKPIVDRIREITDIIWQTQSRAEELPSGTTLPQITNHPSSDK